MRLLSSIPAFYTTARQKGHRKTAKMARGPCLAAHKCVAASLISRAGAGLAAAQVSSSGRISRHSDGCITRVSGLDRRISLKPECGDTESRLLLRALFRDRVTCRRHLLRCGLCQAIDLATRGGCCRSDDARRCQPDGREGIQIIGLVQIQKRSRLAELCRQHYDAAKLFELRGQGRHVGHAHPFGWIKSFPKRAELALPKLAMGSNWTPKTVSTTGGRS